MDTPWKGDGKFFAEYLCVAAGHVYLTLTDQNCIQVLTKEGAHIRTIGTKDADGSDNEHFCAPGGVCGIRVPTAAPTWQIQRTTGSKCLPWRAPTYAQLGPPHKEVTPATGSEIPE